jgi:hypothetical protein
MRSFVLSLLGVLIMTSHARAQGTNLGHNIVIPDDEKSVEYMNELSPTKNGGYIVKSPAIIEAKDVWISIGYGTGKTREEAKNHAAMAAVYGFNMVIVTMAFAPEKAQKFGEFGWKLAKDGDYVYKTFPAEGTEKTDTAPATKDGVHGFVAMMRAYYPKYTLDSVRTKAVPGK